MVGQGFGTIDGTVYAKFTNTDTARLEELQKSQQVNHSSCAKLKYTVYSTNEKEILLLSTNTVFSEHNQEFARDVARDYINAREYQHDMNMILLASHFAYELLAYDFFINITLLPVQQDLCS